LKSDKNIFKSLWTEKLNKLYKTYNITLNSSKLYHAEQYNGKKSQGFQGRINEKYTNENYFHYLVKKKTL